MNLNPGTAIFDDITVLIDGQQFSRWSGLNVTQAIDNLATGFSFSANSRADIPILRRAFKPFGFQRVQIFLGFELIASGIIESVTASSQADNKTLSIEGRSLTAQLIDNAADIGAQLTGQTLLSLAQLCAGKFGIAALPALPGLGAAPIGIVRPEIGVTYFDLLKEYADKSGLILTDDALGNLVIDKPSGAGAPVAQIIEGAGNFAGAEVGFDSKSRFGSYTVLGQKAGRNFRGVSIDPYISSQRSTIIKEDNPIGATAQEAADWERSKAISRSIGINVTMTGWSDLHGPWQRGQMVLAHIPSCYILQPIPLLVAEVSYQISTGGKTTDLRLVLPETYTGAPPSLAVWELDF